MPDPFAMLRERLLRAGVRPKIVGRYIIELQDHLDDLTLELEAEGLSANEARGRAFARLGNVDALALPMISDRRFHSLAGRVPWAVFLMGPPLAFAAFMAMGASALVYVAKIEPLPMWFDSFHGATQFLVLIACPVLTMWVFMFLAARQRCRPAWPLASTTLSVAFAGALSLSVTPPLPTQAGEISIGATLPSLSYLLALMLLAMAPMFFLNARRGEPFVSKEYDR